MDNIQLIIFPVVGFILGAASIYLYKSNIEKKDAEKARNEAEKITEGARNEAEKIKLEAELKAKQIVEKSKSESDKLSREQQKEFARIEKKLQNKEDNLDKKYETLERRENELSKKEKELPEKEKQLEEKQTELDSIIEDAKSKIEQIAGMSQEAAKRELVNIIENEARHEAAKKLKIIEDEMQETAAQKAKNILALAAQRYAGEYASEKTVSVVQLPSDDLKGRIIGREGRNIRSLELRTGVDLIIDDTPETVVISSLNPIRREVARKSLEYLIQDGRIHPGRIEEIVTQVEEEMDKEMQKSGEEAVFDLGIHGMHPELIKLIGKLKYRTSYSQNMLTHSIEVAFICGVIAAEIGFDQKAAKRAALLHDIGKAVDHEQEGSHVEIGEELVRKYGEHPDVVEAVATYHDPNPQSMLAVLVQAADAVSAARPGARRETYEAYIKRIDDIERIAGSFRGVDKCYAISAGREVRVLVESDMVNDEESILLSSEIAQKIEKEVTYPGQVKITVIREVRSSAQAS
ncbi:MAG: ribonuclease Y [Candidatus Dadabacteria bacterium]|nr:ribonuclease Y [Candidatus Dadabacteria bacterium]